MSLQVKKAYIIAARCAASCDPSIERDGNTFTIHWDQIPAVDMDGGMGPGGRPGGTEGGSPGGLGGAFGGGQWTATGGYSNMSLHSAIDFGLSFNARSPVGFGATEVSPQYTVDNKALNAYGEQTGAYVLTGFKTFGLDENGFRKDFVPREEGINKADAKDFPDIGIGNFVDPASFNLKLIGETYYTDVYYEEIMFHFDRKKFPPRMHVANLRLPSIGISVYRRNYNGTFKGKAQAQKEIASAFDYARGRIFEDLKDSKLKNNKIMTDLFIKYLNYSRTVKAWLHPTKGRIPYSVVKFRGGIIFPTR